MTEPLLVEIIAYAPTGFYHCTHCEVAWRVAGIGPQVHQDQLSDSLPGDLARDYRAVSAWVRQLFAALGERLVVKVVDAASLEGFVKALRYRVRRFPAVVVAGQARFSGPVEPTLAAAGQEISRRLAGG